VEKNSGSPVRKSLRGLSVRRRPQKAGDVLARKIVDHIIDEKLEEGTRLPPERELLEETGVGRSTLREALLLLETRGVIEIRQGTAGGPIVRRPRAADLGEALTLVLMFEGASMLDVLETREEMEAMTVALAAKKLTKAQLTRLQACVDRQKEDIENRDLFLAQSRVFHSIISEAAGNVVTRIVLEALQNTTQMTTAAIEYAYTHRQQVVKEHQDLVDALRARDVQRACDLMRKHVSSSRKYWEKAAGDRAHSPVRWSTSLQNDTL
jgi:DNA-binding FadR family transcriptional regulator